MFRIGCCDTLLCAVVVLVVFSYVCVGVCWLFVYVLWSAVVV